MLLPTGKSQEDLSRSERFLRIIAEDLSERKMTFLSRSFCFIKSFTCCLYFPPSPITTNGVLNSLRKIKTGLTHIQQIFSFNDRAYIQKKIRRQLIF